MTRHFLIALLLLLFSAGALCGYILWLSRTSQQAGQQVDTRPLVPPVTGTAESVTLVVAHDSEGSLEKHRAEVATPSQPNERAREILHVLIGEYVAKSSPHPLAASADVKDVYLLPNNMAVIDTTPAFADGHRSGVLVEMLTIASLVETLAANVPGVARVKILVDGKERETLAGHADLTSFYDVNAIPEMVRTLP